MAQRLRIFVSSPNDLPDERLRADLITDKLSQDYSRFFFIESYRWEHEAMLASKHFQDAIEPPSAFDIVVLILWSRLGTPLPEKTAEREYRGIDGRAPVTGTEWEYEEALKVARERGAPDLLAFRNISPAPIDPRDPDAQARSMTQLEALNAFWKRHFVDRDAFLAAHNEYCTLEEFAQRLEQSLRSLIERRIKTSAAGVAAGSIWHGDPFRGLESYELEHAPIFFGRAAAVTKAIEQLAVSARNGCAFLLVSGASGSGKSSLVKAGIVPRLMKPQRISGMAFLRHAVFRPSAGGGDVILGLAHALTNATGPDVGLPELIASGQDASKLATYLRSTIDDPGYLFAHTLSRLTEAGRASGGLLAFEEAKLILVVDQLEELFTVPGIRPEDRRLFIQLLAGLARSSAIWVIATLRADFWHLAAAIPELVALAEGRGRMELAVPSAAELAEMIRKPIQAAGMSFEAHAESALPLDVVLAEHAAAAPGALPLLSFTLDELYKNAKARGEAVLTHTSYEALGGLEGAIANRADEVLTVLPAAAQAALPRVLRALTTMTGTTHDAPVARAALLSSFAEGSPARMLIEGFIAARLLVASGEQGAAATVRLAHEALISRWTRARDQLIRDRRDLETRDLIERQQRRWRETKGRAQRQLLLRDPDLASAVDLAARWGDEIDIETHAFIRASQQRARRQQRMAMAAVVIFFLVAVGAGAAAVQAFRQQQMADEQRDRALATQSRLLAARAERATSDGDTQTAILLSLEALRAPNDVGPDHYELEAERTLLDALYRNPLRSILRAVGTKYSDAAIAYDGSILAAIGADGSASFWKVDAGARVLTRTQLTIPFGPVTSVVANPARPIFFFFSQDKTFFAWNVETERVVPGVTGTCTETARGLGAGRGAQFTFNTTGERLFVYCADVTIFDLDAAQAIHPRGDFDRFSESPSGHEFAVSKGEAVTVMDGKTGDILTSWQQNDPIEGLAMSYDGKTVLTHNYQGVQFHDSRSGLVSQPPMRTSQARTFGLYVSGKENIFATDGDDAPKVWNAARPAPIQELSGRVTGFLPNGLLVAGTKQDITLWEYPTEGHMGTRFPVRRADLYFEPGHAFVTSSADGKIIVTRTEAGDLYIWSSDPAMLLSATADEGDQLGTPAVVSRDGKTIATSAQSGITIWDASTLKAVNHLALDQKPVALALSGDGRLLVHINSKGNYDIVDAATLRSMKPAPLPEQIAAAGFSADGEKLALGFEKHISIWRVNDGSNLRQCDAIDVIANIVWTDDGMLAYGTKSGTVGILSPDECSSRQIFSFNVKPPAIANIHAKQRLILANDANQVQVWSESESRQIFSVTRADWPTVFDPSDAVINLFDILPGRRVLVGKNGDSFVRVYELDTRNEILAFKADTNDCCFPAGIVVLPGADRLVTLWSERGAFRLRTWHILPTVEAATAYAKNIVPECLSPQSRKELGLQSDPPRWCIDMEKRPYSSKIWKLWLTDKMRGGTSPSPAILTDERSKLKELAVARDRASDWAGAIAAYERIVAIDRKFMAVDPDEQEGQVELAGMLNGLCWTRAIVGQMEAAMAACNESLQLRAEDPDTLDSRGFVYLKLKQWSESIAEYDAALRINPRAPSSLYGRGLAKLGAGDTRGGDADVAAAKRISPDIVQGFGRYGVQ